MRVIHMIFSNILLRKSRKSDRDELVARVWLEIRKIISLGEIAWNSSFMKKILTVQPKMFITGLTYIWLHEMDTT